MWWKIQFAVKVRAEDTADYDGQVKSCLERKETCNGHWSQGLNVNSSSYIIHENRLTHSLFSLVFKADFTHPRITKIKNDPTELHGLTPLWFCFVRLFYLHK